MICMRQKIEMRSAPIFHRLVSVTVVAVFAPLVASSQIMIPQYQAGEYRSDVVYVGSYTSPGYCNYNDGLDFVLNGQQLSLPTGIELALLIDTPEPPNLYLTSGWGAQINVGDSITLVSPDYSYGMAATQAGTIHFHLTASGTPTTAGESYACWIDQLITLSDCNNMWSLMNGESLIPCQVLPPQNIEEHSFIDWLHVTDRSMKWDGSGELNYQVLDILGRPMALGILRKGEATDIEHTGVYVVRLQYNGQHGHVRLAVP